MDGSSDHRADWSRRQREKPWRLSTALVKAACRDAGGGFGGRLELVLYRQSAAVIDTSEHDPEGQHCQQCIEDSNGAPLVTGKTPKAPSCRRRFPAP